VRAPQAPGPRFLAATGVLAAGAAIGALVGGPSARGKGALGGILLTGFAGALAGHLDGPTWRPLADTLSLETLGVFTAMTVAGLVRDARAAKPPPGQLPPAAPPTTGRAYPIVPADSGGSRTIKVGDQLLLRFPNQPGSGQYWLVRSDERFFDLTDAKQLSVVGGQIDQTTLVATNAGTSPIDVRLINFDGTIAGVDFHLDATVA
jgi:hypothetical protein